MGKNKIRDLLKVSIKSPKRANWDKSHYNSLTVDVGYINPVLTDELLPASHVCLDIVANVSTNPLTNPLYGSFVQKVEAFFVPTRLYCQNLDLNNLQPGFSEDFALPYAIPPQGDYLGSFDYRLDEGVPVSDEPISVAPCSLIEMLDMLPVTYRSDILVGTNNETTMIEKGLSVNGVPFVGYFDIFRIYYANPHDRSIPFRVGNPLGADPGYAVVDRYYSLESFDAFVSRVVRNSISDKGDPVPVNVFDAFNTVFSNVGTATKAYSAPPLFKNQRCQPFKTNSDQSDTTTGLHFGLLRRTYLDDYFTAFYSNSFVEYQQSVARVVVSGNSFTINQTRLANRVARFVDNSGLGDSRYGDFLKIHFGTKTNAHLCVPQFLGSLSSVMNFNNVISQSQGSPSPTSVSDNQNLGSRASLGSGYIDSHRKKGHFVEFTASEHGYLMVMYSIVPVVSYYEGVKKMYLKTRFADFYVPEMDAVGYQDLQQAELAVQTLGTVGQHGYFADKNEAVAKHPSWFEYMVPQNRVHGLFTQDSYRNWVLVRPLSYNDDNVAGSGNYLGFGSHLDDSTYVLPEYFNQSFAVQKNLDNFQVNLRFDYYVKQPISKQVLPRM